MGDNVIKELVKRVVKDSIFEFLSFSPHEDGSLGFDFHANVDEWNIYLFLGVRQEDILHFKVANRITWDNLLEIEEKFHYGGLIVIYGPGYEAEDALTVYNGPLNEIITVKDEEIPVLRFKNNDRDYEGWLGDNSSGYVFNHFGGADRLNNKVHYAHCSYLNSTTYGSRTSLEKLCCTDLETLTKYISDHQFPWSFCGHCLKQ